MGVVEVREALAALRAAYDALDAAEVDLLTRPELLEVLDEVQTLSCQLPTQRHRLLAQLRRVSTAREVGAKSWRDVVMIRWRLSSQQAHRWLTEADLLAPRQSFTGAPMLPELAATATAQRWGMITGDHVTVIRLAIKRLPGWVDTDTRTQIEVDWVRQGLGCGPKELEEHTQRTLFLLDQDGPVPDDAERARRRGVTTTTHHPVAMTELKATLTPQAWAVWEVLFARYAAPGMCNPADEHPCTSGTPTQAQIDAEDRPYSQRCHDAMEFIGRRALDKTELGSLNGLPTAILVRTTLQELHDRAGIGVTGGGTLIPISEVLAMAARADATHYLAVFDRATGSALNLYRSRRTASPAQRLALIARDGGCTKPGCTVPAYGTQAHHARADWNHGGDTNVDDLALACGPDNRSVTPHGWSTTLNEHHQVEWTPPPGLDTGQHRINHYHHPEQLHPPHTTWHPEHRNPSGETVGGDVVDGEAVVEGEVVVDGEAVVEREVVVETDGVPEIQADGDDTAANGDEVVAEGDSTAPGGDGAKANVADAGTNTNADPTTEDETTVEDDATATESGTSETVTNCDEFEGEGTAAETESKPEAESEPEADTPHEPDTNRLATDPASGPRRDEAAVVTDEPVPQGARAVVTGEPAPEGEAEAYSTVPGAEGDDTVAQDEAPVPASDETAAETDTASAGDSIADLHTALETDDTEYWWPVEDAPDIAADSQAPHHDAAPPPTTPRGPDINGDNHVGEPGGPAPPRSSAA